MSMENYHGDEHLLFDDEELIDDDYYDEEGDEDRC